MKCKLCDYDSFGTLHPSGALNLHAIKRHKLKDYHEVIDLDYVRPVIEKKEEVKIVAKPIVEERLEDVLEDWQPLEPNDWYEKKLMEFGKTEVIREGNNPEKWKVR